MRLNHPYAGEVLIDPHSHSKYSDGLSTPASMFNRAKKRGLQGLIITDHDTVRHWGDCLTASEKFGLVTALGVEISTSEGHILAYFDRKASAKIVARYLKLDQGKIHYLNPEVVIQKVRHLDGIICVPHPFGPFYPLGAKYFDQVDGVEEYNSWIFQDNRRFHNAFGYAKRHHIAAIGGSDSHYPYTLGFGASAVPATLDFSQSDWFLQCVRQRLTCPVVQQKPLHRRINFIKSTVSIPLNVRYNAKFFRSKWDGYWRKNYREVLKRGLRTPHHNDSLTS